MTYLKPSSLIQPLDPFGHNFVPNTLFCAYLITMVCTRKCKRFMKKTLCLNRRVMSIMRRKDSKKKIKVDTMRKEFHENFICKRCVD